MPIFTPIDRNCGSVLAALDYVLKPINSTQNPSSPWSTVSRNCILTTVNLNPFPGERLDPKNCSIEHDYLWAENERQRLRDVWYKHALAVGQVCCEAGNWREALEIYDAIEKRFPYLEEIYVLSMKLYVNNGDLQLANMKYEQLCSMLQEEYGIQPSLSIRQWVEQLNN